ncbi:uncharacterized protein LOC125840666 [Solanum verrucosum]|uniref:uncharacterized protein LOC125840666 n=1 Tax=Solanum verrucosum TaxID=315347 RepID=UPI0020D18477|nr:uncharacterized protein LOC125840666 [Solanum verrucosum]
MPVDKAELADYQRKGVAQVWFNQWKEERAVDTGPLDWEKLKVVFLDRLFPFEMRDENILEFINLRQGNMSVKEYVLKFTQLSKYAPTMIVDPRERMKENFRERYWETKKARTGDGNFSHSRSDAHGRSEFRQRFFGQGSSNDPPKFNKDKVSNPNPQGRNGGGSSLSTCARCERKHEGKCLADMDGCVCCGKSGHKIRDCPSLTAKGREGRQASPSGSSSSAPKKN